MTLPKDRDARKYFRVARQRLQEGELVLTKLDLASAAMYLMGYAAECAIKALLLEDTPAGAKRDMLRSLKESYGHSLSRLRVELVGRGLNIPRDVLRHLIFVSTVWSPNLRYEPGPGDRDEADRFLAAVKAIVTWVDGRI